METLEDVVWQIWIWQHQNTDSFFSIILRAFRKADASNRTKLASVWPMLPVGMALWEASKDNGEALFRQFNIPESRRGR